MIVIHKGRILANDSVEQTGGRRFQTVRCPFEEGPPVYDGALIKTQSHVQIAVRDRACISSRVYPVGPQGG